MPQWLSYCEHTIRSVLGLRPLQWKWFLPFSVLKNAWVFSQSLIPLFHWLEEVLWSHTLRWQSDIQKEAGSVTAGTQEPTIHKESSPWTVCEQEMNFCLSASCHVCGYTHLTNEHILIIELWICYKILAYWRFGVLVWLYNIIKDIHFHFLQSPGSSPRLGVCICTWAPCAYVSVSVVCHSCH